MTKDIQLDQSKVKQAIQQASKIMMVVSFPSNFLRSIIEFNPFWFSFRILHFFSFGRT